MCNYTEDLNILAVLWRSISLIASVFDNGSVIIAPITLDTLVPSYQHLHFYDARVHEGVP